MSLWAVEGPCTPRCATDTGARVPGTLAARRRAALLKTLLRALAAGDRLAEPAVLGRLAREVLDGLGVRLETRTETQPATPPEVPGTHPEMPVTATPPQARATHRRSPDGARLSLPGPVGTLVVANHVSWLDVIALLAVEPGLAPLAKREVGGWPLIGALARRLGVPFIDRDRPHRLPGAVAALAETLRSGRSVVVFPQATTWCAPAGGAFRPATFQAAIDAGAPVRPVSLDHLQDGRPSAVAAFLGDEDFTACLRRIAGARGLAVRVTVHPPLPATGTDRRALAVRARRPVHGTAPPPGHTGTEPPPLGRTGTPPVATGTPPVVTGTPPGATGTLSAAEPCPAPGRPLGAGIRSGVR
ncbi:1-acyl-sn-glycerol-3-phosphate acyltransferase [Streptomyces sp. LP05-1]|uniref:1-acyl-sn-glycerol-3-phosphate acyltransferase n=1 Tax=Streptomyces pyxinae TaxID=2970734 RepID=A0ABT2CGH4_9ACTN|nr:lysophospholipid acyltransferase family protein [Streptomyces sp. LP05-1]MCS0635806.1 1-acyl-sn-glycerol-3-phosphate acyltransferase [Streptomyces sp. LP05-1]